MIHYLQFTNSDLFPSDFELYLNLQKHHTQEGSEPSRTFWEHRVGSGSGLSGPFSEVAVKMPMEYWLPFGLVLLFQILCIRASPFRISYFAL